MTARRSSSQLLVPLVPTINAHAASKQYVDTTVADAIAGDVTMESIDGLIPALDGKVDKSLLDTKGDLIVASGPNTPALLPVGADGFYLQADSSQTNGLKWAPVASGTFADNALIIQDQSDTSKQARFDVLPGQTSGTTRTHQLPTVDGLLLNENNAATLTNKTISGASNTLTNISVGSLTGTLPVGNGGTGAVTLTGLVKGNGASPMTAVTAPSGAIVGTTDTQTLTNKRVTVRVGSTASSATPSFSADSFDQYNVTALAAAITSWTISGTPTDGQKLMLRIKDNGTARTLAWPASIISSGAATLPTTTAAGKTHHIGLIYDAVAAKWVCIAADSTGY